MKIDLDQLLYGDCSWEQISEFFQNGEFYEESNLVEAIEKHLLTKNQRKTLFKNKLSIEKMLNGRHTDSSVVYQIFDEWNKKLGVKVFRS